MNNILIIKPSSFGDVIQALPVAAGIRAFLPGARISWLVNTQYARLLANNPCVDRVFLFERDLWRVRRDIIRAALTFAALCRTLRRAGFDAVLDLQGLFRSGFLAAVTAAPVRAGFASARECAHLFYNRRVRIPDAEMHAVERYLLLPGALGCGRSTVTFPLGVGDEERRWADGVLCGMGGRGASVGLSPAARWKTKRWPARSFAALGDALSSAGADVVVVGGPAGEAAAVARLMRRQPVIADRIVDPLKMAALVRRLDVLVTNDSGPMHLAAAVGTPVVALFGPTNPLRTGPYGAGHRVICAPVDCRPCYERVCPRDDDCMRTIGVETVQAAVAEVLSKRGRPRS